MDLYEKRVILQPSNCISTEAGLYLSRVVYLEEMNDRIF